MKLWLKVLLVSSLGIGAAPGQDVFRSDPPSLGGVLYPHLHMIAVAGDSTRNPADLAEHGHDPNDQFTLQGIEVGASLRLGEHLRGFANYNVFIDLEDEWDGEWEEAFLKLENLPGGFELRGGRIFNRVGRQNPHHLHAWDFVDANLITSRMLGEEGLVTNSGEITWNLPVPLESFVSVAFGETVPHEEHSHGHAHGGGGGGPEGEEGVFDTNVLSGRLDVLWDYNDFHRFRFGGSVITGDNMFGRTTSAAGLDVEYLWRQNGYEEGGCSVRWLTEVLAREIEYENETTGALGDDTELGLVTAVLFGFAEGWETGFRYGWVSGSNELEELPERHRWSAVLTRSCDFGSDVDGFVRLQYNHEDHDEFGAEDSIWLQFGFNWGGPEVR